MLGPPGTRATTTPGPARIAGYGSDKRRATWSKAIAASSSRSRLSKNVMKGLILQIALKQHYQSRWAACPTRAPFSLNDGQQWRVLSRLRKNSALIRARLRDNSH